MPAAEWGPNMAVSLVCAVVAAFGYGIGSVMQAAAARKAERRANLDPMLLVRLMGEVPYVGGLTLDFLGFVASVVALRTLPLFVVQSAVAASVGVTAIAASVAFGVRLLRYERVALVVLMFGFALLAISARPERAASFGAAGKWILVCGVVVVAVAGALSARLDDRKAGIGLALCAGLAWAGTGIAARVLQMPSPPSRLLDRSRCAVLGNLRDPRCAPLRHRAPTRIGHRGRRARVHSRNRRSLAPWRHLPRRPRPRRLRGRRRTRIRRDARRIHHPRPSIRTPPTRTHPTRLTRIPRPLTNATLPALRDS